MKLFILFFLLGFVHLSLAQHQLVLIKSDQVQVRFIEGDDFVYKRKSSRKVIKSFIVEINDSTLITNHDTIATHQIEKLYFKKGNLLNILGGFMVLGGAGIFVIDQINTNIVRQEKASLDDNVTAISVTSLAIGLPLFLLKKGAHRVGYKQRLKIIDKGSPFYTYVTR